MSSSWLQALVKCSFYLSDLGGILTNHNDRMAEIDAWNILGHIPGDTEGRKCRPCRLCTIHDVRSSSGQKVRVRHRCLGCDIPLCLRHRDCFYQFHKRMFSQQKSGK